MNDKFRNLPKEKQDRILNGAISIFGKHEYKKATTDEIITSAGISKGLLFHYFGSKKKLYLSLFEYCIEYCVNIMNDSMDQSETDFFEILRITTCSKLKIIQQYPAIFDFLMRVYHETASEVIEEVNTESNKLSQEFIASLFQNVDYSKFKEHMNLEMIINTITWAAKGFVDQKNQQGEINPEQIIEEFDAYLQMYRQAFYKEEYV
ncbi:TetR/AcrR family transcriptional regulator [Bacillus massiliigorillae]|uniref:TetR/AcrR family transcriptional regulator n=1 Tax=Bacillus massiliigorillae TaxID=1243664 RepID=UPI0003A7F0DF|nr:TetR/AcrR family transcriptional regulator [Bacillus massiliigorillae]